MSVLIMASGEVPSISDISIEPRTLTAGQNVRISVRVTSNLTIRQINAEYLRGLSPLSLEQGQNPRSGIWSGILPLASDLTDGNYDIYVSVYAEGQDLQGAPMSRPRIGNIMITPSQVPPVGSTSPAGENRTADGDRVTTLTIRGPITVQNTTSKTGECEIRISVRGQVIIDCEKTVINP